MKKLMAFMLLALVCSTASAQITQKDKDDFFGKEDKDDFFGKGTKEDFFSNNDPGFAAERQKMYENYNKFRKEALKNYSDYVRKAWKDYKANPAIEAPKDEMIKPQMAPDSEERTASWFIKIFGKEKKKDTKKTKPKSKPAERKPEVLKVETVIKAEPVIPQPEPQIPAEPRVEKANNYMTFSVFGTDCKVRIGDNCRYKLPNASTAAVADAIENVFPGQQFENLLYDCLQERKRHDFSDWAYYQMLLALTQQFYGDCNEAVLAQAFLYSQSGYKMRLAHTSQKLYMLAATRHFIFNKQFYVLGGENYFLLSDNKVDQLGICEASFPKESSLSLQITASQEFGDNPTMERTITSRYNEDFSFTISSNKNYIDFFETYPSSTVNNNFMSRWAMYANTPLEKGVKDQLYPPMKAKLKGLSQQEAVQQLLWWMHGTVDTEGKIKNANCFLYNYDDNVWGVDRAFFGEETLFYPYCDCEDRSILLSHLVRDLLGLDVVLVYYPGHLAMAVNFTEPVKGDYVMLDGRKFIVCDPTFIGGRVGDTMTGMENESVTAILLNRIN
jgi:hypothetical protein